MQRLSDRIKNMSESQTIAMSRKSRELIASGIDVINLSLGEPDFNTPDPIKEAAKNAIDDNFSFYTHVSGYLELREAICRKFKRDNNLEFTPDNIVVSTGAKQSIINVLLCLLNPGDEVLVPAPYWVSYIEMVKLTGAVPIVLPTSVENNFKFTREQIKKSITPKTRLILFSSPCNPTGTVFSKDELEEIAREVSQHEDMMIISDEIYEHINFTGRHHSIAEFDFIKDRVVIVNGVSKGFAMTGWRVGFIAAPDWIAKACDKMQGQFTSATSSIAQKATEAAMDLDPVEATGKMKEAFRKRRDVVLQGLSEIPGIKCNFPEGAFYVFPEINSYFGKKFNREVIENASDLCMYLLSEANVALVPGDAFGSPDCIRFSYAASEDKLREAINRMSNALQKLE